MLVIIYESVVKNLSLFIKFVHNSLVDVHYSRFNIYLNSREIEKHPASAVFKVIVETFVVESCCRAVIIKVAEEPSVIVLYLYLSYGLQTTKYLKLCYRKC